MNVDIEYKENQSANISDLMELYTDAGWVNYIKDPEKLERAYENPHIPLLHMTEQSLSAR